MCHLWALHVVIKRLLFTITTPIKRDYFRPFVFCLFYVSLSTVSLNNCGLIFWEFLKWTWSRYIHFRSTLWQSQPNETGLKCPSVRPSVHTYVRTYMRRSVRPQKFFRFQWNLASRYGRWVMHGGMHYAVWLDPRSSGQGHEHFKVGNPAILKAISSAIYNGNWQLTTDS